MTVSPSPAIYADFTNAGTNSCDADWSWGDYLPPQSDPHYNPSPQINTIYAGPDIPTAYDPNWQLFTNLTKDQIAWFQAQPEWQNFLNSVALSPITAMAGSASLIK